jgi:NAD(P)-dependent dehydrogenase (short-subunit alcohol dehydrogenase family)
VPTVLITGANRGIGLTFARSYAADGWRVHACCRAPERAGDLKGLAGDIEIHRCDVTDKTQVASLARALDYEPIDLLINNAGVIGNRRGLGEIDYETWIEVLKVNTLAPLRVAEHFLPHLGSGQQKKIVTISSRMGSIVENTSGGHYLYRSSKAALNMVMKSLAVDVADKGLTVVVMHPGWVRTDMGGPDALIDTEESVAGMRRVIDGLTPADNGKFYNYDGQEFGW